MQESAGGWNKIFEIFLFIDGALDVIRSIAYVIWLFALQKLNFRNKNIKNKLKTNI